MEIKRRHEETNCKRRSHGLFRENAFLFLKEIQVFLCESGSRKRKTMKGQSLLWFMLTCVWVELCFAQPAEKYYMYNGLFFEGMPPGVCSSDISAFITHEDTEGQKMIELKLQKGKKPAEGYQSYQTPATKVPQAAFFLASVRMGEGRRLPVMSANALKKNQWIGKPFPEFKVTDWSGKVWTRDDIVGKPTVLNFWYSGCGPCRREMPDLNHWMEALPEVNYLATTFDEKHQVQSIIENTPFLYTHILGEMFFFNLFKISGMPVTILVDKKGIIRYIEEGAGTAKLRYLFNFLKKLVDE